MLYKTGDLQNIQILEISDVDSENVSKKLEELKQDIQEECKKSSNNDKDESCLQK